MDWSDKDIDDVWARFSEAVAAKMTWEGDDMRDCLASAAVVAMNRAVELYLARLAPTGQVAEDVKLIKAALSDPDLPSLSPQAQGLDALSRLAAVAHAREQAERERDAARGLAKEWERLRNEAYDLYRKAGDERDTARQEAESLRSQLNGAQQNEALALEQGGRDQEEIDRLKAEVRQMVAQVAESTRLAEERLAERNATQAEVEALRARVAELEADNATAFDLLSDAHGVLARVRPDHGPDGLVPVLNGVKTALAADHHGAALLEKHAKALVRAKNEGIEKAAAKARSAAEHGCNPYASCTCDWEAKIDSIADDILNLKEPES